MWTNRSRRTPSKAAGPEAPDEGPPAPVQRAAPGVAELFGGLKGSAGHSVLDLGPASASHLRLFGAFARQIRFAGLLPCPPRGSAWLGAIQGGLPPHTRRPYDLVLAWDIFDRIGPDERGPLIDRLAAITAPGARLHAIVDTSGRSTTRAVRYTLLAVDRVSQLVVGPPEPAEPALLPASVERLLAPFEVVRGFTLRSGLREYVAVKRGGIPDGS